MEAGQSTRRKSVSRRAFLSASAAACLPTIVPPSVFGAHAPSNRINLACIGLGNQGSGLLSRALRFQDAQVVAVCDVNAGSYGYRSPDQFLGRDPAQKLVNEHYAEARGRSEYCGCAAYSDFRDVLQQEGIDAVVIAAPDHWHALMTIRAAEAGKDIYCEKPLSLTIAEGRAMVDAVREHGRVLQTGSKERSNPLNRHVCQVVRDGMVGEIKRVITNFGYHNMVGPGPGWKAMKVPNGFDYSLWLGPAPVSPYHEDRCLYRFRFNYDYAGGQVTNFGVHSNDLAQWGLGADDTGPEEIEFVHAKWLPDGSLYNVVLEGEFRCHYATGAELVCRTAERKVGVRFEGTEGWIESDAYPWIARSEPASLVTDKFPDGRLAFDTDTAHMREFLDCVRSRANPSSHAEIGHRSATVCHLGNIAFRLGRDLRWDPQAETFAGDAEADSLLSREMRSPWRI